MVWGKSAEVVECWGAGGFQCVPYRSPNRCLYTLTQLRNKSSFHHSHTDRQRRRKEEKSFFSFKWWYVRDEDTRNLSFVFRGLIEEVRSQRYKKGEKCFLFFHPFSSNSLVNCETDSRGTGIWTGASAAIVHDHFGNRRCRRVEIVTDGEIGTADASSSAEFAALTRWRRLRSRRRRRSWIGSLLFDVLTVGRRRRSRRARSGRWSRMIRRANRQILGALLTAVFAVVGRTARFRQILLLAGWIGCRHNGGRFVATASGHLDDGPAFSFHQRQGSGRHSRRQRRSGSGKIVLIGRVEGGSRSGGGSCGRIGRCSRWRRRRRDATVRTRRGDAQLFDLVVQSARRHFKFARRLQGAHPALDGLNGGRYVAVCVLLVTLPFQFLCRHVGRNPGSWRIHWKEKKKHKLLNYGQFWHPEVVAYLNCKIVCVFFFSSWRKSLDLDGRLATW